MRVQYLYDQGSSKHWEDGLVVKNPFFGVIDATSAPFSAKNPAMSFEGLTGGEMVARTIEKSFLPVRHSLDLTTMISSANKEVTSALVPFGLKDAPVDRLPGACFAFAKIDADEIELVQAGDCYAIWENNSGGIGLFRNQVRQHDTEMNAKIEEIMTEVAREMKINLKNCSAKEKNRVRQEMWNRFFPILSAARRMAINNPRNTSGYGLLNGRPEISRMWQGGTIFRKRIKFLLLCTDGMIPWKTARALSDRKIARSLCQLFEEGGLAKILLTARTVENTSREKAYTDFAEATAIAIQF